MIVTALAVIIVGCGAVAALVVLELNERRRGGRGLPVLRRMPARRVRS